MKNLFLFAFLLFVGNIFAQNEIYSIQQMHDANNLNLDWVDPGTYQVGGDHATNGIGQGFLSRHNGQSTVWSIDIDINGAETILSDQVVLPDGNTAVTGVYFSNQGVWEPYIMLIDPSGNNAGVMGYQGFARPFVATHKIIYDPNNEHLVICGANRMDDPLASAFSFDQVGFVMAVSLHTLQPEWYQEIENGQSTNGVDYDLVESMEVLMNESILVTGSISDQSNPHQRLLIAQLDSGTGHGIVQQYDLSFGSTRECGAAILQIDPDVAYVLVNATRGLEVLCYDLINQNVAARHRIHHQGDLQLTGYQLEYPAPVSAFYVGGYLKEHIHASPNHRLRPFSLQLEPQDECAVYLGSNQFLFEATNNMANGKGAYTSVVGPDFINTPDMFVYQDQDEILTGFRMNAVDVDVVDHVGGCRTNCVEPLPVNLLNMGSLLPSFVTGTVQGQVFQAPVGGNAIPRNENLQLECTLDNMGFPANCGVTVTPICPTQFMLSADCIDPCYLPTYTWDIPGLCVSNHTAHGLSVNSFGGTYNYDLTVTYVHQGTTYTNTYSGWITLPNFNCNDISITPQLTHVSCTDYVLGFIPNVPLCSNATYDITVNRNEAPPICPVVANSTNPVVPIDVSVCGEGWYFYYVDITFVDNCGNPLTCTYFNGSKVYATDFSLDPPNVLAQAVIGSNNPWDICGGDDYLEHTVTTPLGPNFVYDWGCNGTFTTNSVYECCDFTDVNCTNPCLTVRDINTGCEYTLNGVYGPRSPVQDPEAPVILENRISETITEQFDVQAYPNPVSDMLQIQLQGPGKAQATLYNLQGQTLQQRALHPATSELDLSMLPAGIYFLQVIDETTGAQITQRIMKI